MSEPLSDQRDRELQRVKDAALALGEYFDCVQIFTTRHDQGMEDGTVNINFGCGNYFARVGQVRCWLIKEDEGTRMELRKEDE